MYKVENHISSRVLFANIRDEKKVYYIKDEASLKDITDTAKTVEEYLADGYTLILEDFYEDNINYFNDCLVLNPIFE